MYLCNTCNTCGSTCGCSAYDSDNTCGCRHHGCGCKCNRSCGTDEELAQVYDYVSQLPRTYEVADTCGCNNGCGSNNGCGCNNGCGSSNDCGCGGGIPGCFWR